VSVPARLLRAAAGAAILLAAASLAGCDGAPTEEPTDGGGGPTQEPFHLEVGDCVAPDESEEQAAEPSPGATEAPPPLDSLPVVDCGEPHAQEVFASDTLPNGGYPGQQLILEEANRACLDEFRDFVGLRADQSELKTSFLYPTPGSWTTGDREILCLISDPAGPTTGSLRGAQR